MNKIDCHIHAQTNGNYHEDICRLITHMQRHGISKALISDLGDNWMAYPDSETLITANARVKHEAENSSGRLEYLVYINPQLPDWRDIFLRFIDGACGVKLWISLRSETGSLEETKDVLRLAAKYDKAVLIHTFGRTVPTLPGEIGIPEIIELARAVPQCRIVAAHAGGNWRKAIELADEIPENVSLDISGSFPERTMVRRLADAFGCDRLLYGSDAFGRSFGSQLSKVYESDLAAEDMEKILRLNSIRIFKLAENAPAEEGVSPETWSIPELNEDNFCFVGKGKYWDHSVTPEMLVENAVRHSVDTLFAADLFAFFAEDRMEANRKHLDACRSFPQIAPLAVADLNDMEETLSQLDGLAGFAGVLISPYLHNYRLEYSAHAKFFDLCAKRGVPVWINTSLGDDRFRDARLITRTVLPEDILEFTENAPRNRYVFQGVLPTPELSKQLPEYCKLECSKLSDHEYAPEEFFSRGAVEHLCFGSEYPFRDFGSVSNVLEGKL